MPPTIIPEFAELFTGTWRKEVLGRSKLFPDITGLVEQVAAQVAR